MGQSKERKTRTVADFPFMSPSVKVFAFRSVSARFSRRTSAPTSPKPRSDRHAAWSIRRTRMTVPPANPQGGMRQLLVTGGATLPEIFHKGGKEEGYQVFVSEGLVKACTSNDQLAAIFCVEIGKMVSERETVLSAGGQPGTRRLPPA